MKEPKNINFAKQEKKKERKFLKKQFKQMFVNYLESSIADDTADRQNKTDAYFKILKILK